MIDYFSDLLTVLDHCTPVIVGVTGAWLAARQSRFAHASAARAEVVRVELIRRSSIASGKVEEIHRLVNGERDTMVKRLEGLHSKLETTNVQLGEMAAEIAKLTQEKAKLEQDAKP